jgi:signal transduction histidine kinase/ActR/RegA family two-component response regulator
LAIIGIRYFLKMLIPLNNKIANPSLSCRFENQMAAMASKLKEEIARRKSAEDARQASEDKYQSLFETAAVSFLEVDLSAVKQTADDLKKKGINDLRSYLPDHPELLQEALKRVTVKKFNMATLRLFQADTKALLVGSAEKILASQSLDVFREALIAICEARPDFETEMVSQTLAGENINILMSFQIPEAKEKFETVLVSLTDISERKRLESQFFNAQKMEAIGTLAGGIAHDFNNLLMAIEGLASLILQDTGADHPHYATLTKIEKQVKNGAKLTAQLLGYARRERTESTLIDINQVVRETAEAFGRTRKQIAINLDLDDALRPVDANPGQIEQVLLNLCVNAADAMSNGGRLSFKSTNATREVMPDHAYMPKRGEYVQLDVQDSGVGMDEATRERIFEPFFTTKEMGRGTGLGLASVFGIVKSLGGFIEVDSEIERGTTFHIFLPASSRILTVDPQPAGEQTVMTSSRTVLLVDDEEVVLDVGVQMLQHFGYVVLPAASGQEALQIYAENKEKIDLVILDMVMPDLGGRVVYDRLKQCNPEVKVLLSSGYSLSGEASEIMKCGCNGFIQKPFNIKELTAQIDHILQQR